YPKTASHFLGMCASRRACIPTARSNPRAVGKSFDARLGLSDVASRRNAVCEPDIAADRGAAADLDASEDCRSRIDRHVVLDDRMSGLAFHERAARVGLKPL